MKKTVNYDCQICEETHKITAKWTSEVEEALAFHNVSIKKEAKSLIVEVAKTAFSFIHPNAVFDKSRLIAA